MGAGLLDRIRMLETFPFAGKIVEEFDNPAIRELVLPPYRIVYRIDKRGKIIGIARFWHGARGVLDTLQLNEPGSAFVVKNQTCTMTLEPRKTRNDTETNPLCKNAFLRAFVRNPN
jgi:hypothetical protein